MIILEDEFHDLDDTDRFGQGGWSINSGDRRYDDITLVVRGKAYSGCRAAVSYEVDFDGRFVPATYYNPPEYPEIIIRSPFVKFFEIDANMWKLTSPPGTVWQYFDQDAGLWTKENHPDNDMPGPLSKEEVKLVIAQILEYWEDEEEEMLEYENQLYYSDR